MIAGKLPILNKEEKTAMKYYGSTTSEMSAREKRNAALARRAAARVLTLIEKSLAAKL